MKTWLKILTAIIVLIILYFMISFILLITHPFIDGREKFQYSTTKNIFCKLQSSKIRHYYTIPCKEFDNLEEGRFKSGFMCNCGFENIPEASRICRHMCGPSYCKSDMFGYTHSQCVAPKLA